MYSEVTIEIISLKMRINVKRTVKNNKLKMQMHFIKIEKGLNPIITI
jgi:hypothetical protein